MLLPPKILDLENSNASLAGALDVQPAGLRSETNLADLVASFAVQSGKEVSPELSGVALEIVLNQIVEHACLTTGATGAAIILPIEGDMVCRASCGSTAPDVGDRLDTSGGPFAECITSQAVQRCDDILADSQANVAAVQQWGVRSMILMPLTIADDCAGIFGLFSSQPSAFEKSIEHTMAELAGRTLSNLQSGAALAEEASKTMQFEESFPSEPARRSVLRSFEVVTMALALVAIVCALLLGFLVGRHFDSWTTVRTHPPAPPLAAPQQTPVTPSTYLKEERPQAIIQNPEPIKITPAKPVPPGGLVVLENGKEIFRIPPSEPSNQLAEQH